MESVSFYLNNKLVTSDTRHTILQASSSVGVEIPRFCYHPTLSVAANCRMCLVEVQDSGKPVASCAMQITPGSRVSTLSFFVKKARESTLEFLLINHPLDCPICDQGGECDLQDQTLVFGSDRGRFYEKKRAVKNFFAGWLIKTFMTRCIHCTRCVRFNSEIELENKIGVLGRGSSMKISNFVNARLNSGFSGNLADLCPVGALVSKPYSFTARPWELRTSTSLDLSDSLLFKVRLDIKGEEIKRVLPTTSGSLESFFISDKGRFYFDGLFYQRLVRPDFRNLRGSKTWRNSLSRTAILFLSKLGQRINLSSSRNYFFEMEFKLIGKNDFHFFEKIYQKNQTIGDKRYLMFFGPKTEKLKDVFEFSVKVNFFSKAYRFFFNAANQQSRNEGLSAEKKLFLLKGAFSALSWRDFARCLGLSTLLTENFLNHG